MYVIWNIPSNIDEVDNDDDDDDAECLFCDVIIKMMTMQSGTNVSVGFSGHTKNVGLPTYYSRAQRVGDAESRNEFQKRCTFVYLYLLLSRSSFSVKKCKAFSVFFTNFLGVPY